MPRFFVEHANGDKITITGDDAAHISRVLRMGVGDDLIVCENSTDIEYFCKIADISASAVTLSVDRSQHSAAEPDVKVHLYQALPKSDKMELIIQKAVELGVCEITPMLTRRCVSRPDAKSLAKKRERWQKIAYEAAKQSGRGRIPVVHPVVEYKDAVQQMGKVPLSILFYELGGNKLKELLQSCPSQVSIAVGAEGGFDEEEVACAVEQGIRTATLGKRILRCETAPLCALSAIMFETGNLN
ncbi:16S rRNA (uracil(1498)-N(3))-methyltransferase [Hydrogenoanaerobacterium sp.]|uniref:16S rRNA (uracil(1498)-N(3))-methyltransferase n=1 Tax=Hydrogenoanaerobacterium sp. TaxID=2953763 RepID=UPI0028A1F12F|nr:16S rRNA (uracil(1498)-N(3))-methyltransferase [Hydrogenoanaerobacterium sp.]